MMTAIFIAAFGALGVLCRFSLGQATLCLFGASSIMTTLFINVAGSGLIGYLATLPTIARWSQEPWQSALTIGFLGGFTTFSAYSLEVVRLLNESRLFAAACYGLLSPSVSIAAAFVGVALARRG